MLYFVVATNLILFPVSIFAAPFSEYIEFTQPDKTQLTLWGEGDEFHAVFETTTGYSVVFDSEQKAYYFANRSSDGNNLISSGVLAHHQAPQGLLKHIRIDKAAAISKARAKRKQWETDTELPERWSRMKSQALNAPAVSDVVGTDAAGLELAPPSSNTVGAKVGLTLLIDFSDATATIPQAVIEAFLNGDSYTGYSNNGSVKKYFSDVSNGRLTYTNVVTLYVRMAKPKSYYNVTAPDNSGTQGRLLINDALTILKARGDYTSTILPAFESLTVDGSSRVLAFNVFFAGGSSGVWSQGLWPHSWNLASAVKLGNGKSVYKYQITNVGTSLALGTFSHENGHMLCGFPDLYDYDSDSKGGAGNFSIMGSGSNLVSGKNPSQVDAYLKLVAGWATVIDLTSASNLTGTLVAAPAIGYNTFYRYKKPGVTTEYFLLENRQKTGRDAGLPSSGIAVWHVDQLGDRDNQSLTPNTSHLNYELTLVQADNLWHFENNTNNGDAYDLYYLGNRAAAYTNHLDDSSSPDGNWWDGSLSGMNFNNFSTSGITMTFNSGVPPTLPGAPTIVSVSAGNTQASISFAPPFSNGGSSITGYTVASNTGQVVFGTTIPITMSNLTNGEEYSFSVTASNAVGTGPSSTVWGVVIPGVVFIQGADAGGYQLLQKAYDSDLSGRTIKILSDAQVGGLVVNASNNKGAVSITGGYDNAFSAASGLPSILRSLTLSAGTTRLQNVVIRP
jgi:M6 family metalloprotease-like protein